MKAKCIKCGDTVEVTKPREYKTCKCGAISLDYGDGENYYRTVGNPEDFDGEIEDVPKIRFADDPMERAMDIIGEENIGGYSGKATTTFKEPIEIDRHHGWDKAPVKTDTFWSEMAEHFRAIAKLCEEKSKL